MAASYGSYGYGQPVEQPSYGYGQPMEEPSGHPHLDFAKKFADPAVMSQLSMGLMALMMMGSMMGMMGGDRKKRSASPQIPEHLQFDITDTNMFFKVISDMDEDDCIALALCHVSSVPLTDRSREQIIFSEAFRLSSEIPLPWNNRNDNSAKYQYAAFIGRMLDENDTQCTTVFPKCKLGPNDVLRLFLQTEHDICKDQSADSENLREDIFNAFLIKRRLSTAEGP